jgi:hypothetical protein
MVFVMKASPGVYFLTIGHALTVSLKIFSPCIYRLASWESKGTSRYLPSQPAILLVLRSILNHRNHECMHGPQDRCPPEIAFRI